MSKILVVDDQPDVRNTLAGLLRDEGHAVQTASNEGEALALVTQESFDFALIDVRLHGGEEHDESGISLAVAVRHLNPQIRVIMLTQYVRTPQVVRAIRYHGVVDFIEKTPDMGEQILQTLKEASKEPLALRFQQSPEQTTLSLLLTSTRPLVVRARGRYIHSGYTPEILKVDMASYVRKTDIARRALTEDRRFQVQDIGQDLWRDLFANHTEVSRAFLEARAASQSLSLVFEISREFLGLPLEFTRLGQPPEYLVLEHPVSRFICDATPRREAISPQFLARAKKLRVLIIASNTCPPINGVDRETWALDTFLRHQKYIPVDVKLIPTEHATNESVKAELQDAQYDIIHYAGHGQYDAKSPEDSCLYFWSYENRQGNVTPMKATELKRLAQSEVRLVYLSCCYGSASGNVDALLNDDFLGLADTVIQAGVPSVVGFRWPVSDIGAPQLTQIFYRSLLEQGSPEIALWKARCELAASNRNDMTWLSPILIHQA